MNISNHTVTLPYRDYMHLINAENELNALKSKIHRAVQFVDIANDNSMATVIFDTNTLKNMIVEYYVPYIDAPSLSYIDNVNVQLDK